jgi:beta-lactamase regulating signal transducer with metallopeptidase domain
MTAAATLNPIAMNAIAQTSTIQIVAIQIVNCLVEGTLIAIFAGAVLKFTRQGNSSTKFAIWFSALMGIAALPALIGISGASWAHGTSPAQTASHATITLPGFWALCIFVAWAAIAAWSLLGIARSLWHLLVLRKSCVPVDPAILDTRVRETLARAGSPRPVALCTSDLVQVPTAIGLVKPAVILPSWILEELSPQELNQILLHELAHLRRWDDWTNLAQKLVKALFFFHPAVWWIERQVSLEREMACDDAVVAETCSPRAYAECLAHLAEKTLVQRSLARQSLAQRSVALAQAALGRIRHTSLRVAQILNPNRPTGTGSSWKAPVSFVAVFAVASVGWISSTPRLIAFQDRDAASVVSPTTARISTAGNARTPVIQTSELNASNLISKPAIPVVQASLKLHSTHRSFQSSKRSVAMQSQASAPIPLRDQTSPIQTNLAQTYFHLANAAVTPVAFTETFFVVIEGPSAGSSDQPVLQIQWWRVTVLHPAVDSDSNRIPPKKT